MTERKETNPKDALAIRKVPIHLVPMQVLSEVGLAMLEGGRKYGGHNYRDTGVKASVYIDAVWRHLFLQFWERENYDVDSGLHHVTKAIASLIVLRDSMLMDNWVDNRPIRHPGKLHAQKLNEKAGDIIDKYPDCVPPFTEQTKTETVPGYGGDIGSPKKNIFRIRKSDDCVKEWVIADGKDAGATNSYIQGDGTIGGYYRFCTRKTADAALNRYIKKGDSVI